MISFEKTRKLLETRGISETDLVKKDHVVSDVIYKDILHDRPITCRNIDHLCEYLHCNVDDLMEYISDPPKS